MNLANPLDLSDRSILVTGASSGIGREVAVFLSELNARLILVGRNPERLHATLEQLHGTGHRAEEFDLTRLTELGPWMKTICKAVGPLGGLVHSAGAIAALPIQVVSAPKVEDLLRTNLSTSIMLARALRQSGCYQKGTSVVYLTSAAGRVGSPGLSIYSATKAGVAGFVRSFALEVAPIGIRVNCVAPGVVDAGMTESAKSSFTPEQFQAIVDQHPLGLGSARDVAHAIAFLLAETGRWITGTELVVDGGFTA